MAVYFRSKRNPVEPHYQTWGIGWPFENPRTTSPRTKMWCLSSRRPSNDFTFCANWKCWAFRGTFGSIYTRWWSRVSWHSQSMSGTSSQAESPTRGRGACVTYTFYAQSIHVRLWLTNHTQPVVFVTYPHFQTFPGRNFDPPENSVYSIKYSSLTEMWERVWIGWWWWDSELI